MYDALSQIFSANTKPVVVTEGISRKQKVMHNQQERGFRSNNCNDSKYWVAPATHATVPIATFCHTRVVTHIRPTPKPSLWTKPKVLSDYQAP